VSSRKPLPDVLLEPSSTDQPGSVDESTISSGRCTSFVGLVRFHFFREGVDFSFFSRSEFRVKLNRVRPVASHRRYSFYDAGPSAWWNRSSGIKIR